MSRAELGRRLVCRLEMCSDAIWLSDENVLISSFYREAGDTRSVVRDSKGHSPGSKVSIARMRWLPSWS
jgi:hypothetical protein